METSNKKILLNIAYYSLIVLTVAFSVIFMLIMPVMEIAMYQRVVYTLWAILLILTVIFDVVATCGVDSFKYLVGLIIAGLAFLCLLVGVIIYAGISVGGLIPYYALTRYFVLSGFSVGLTIMIIVLFCTGEKLMSFKTNFVSKRNK